MHADPRGDPQPTVTAPAPGHSLDTQSRLLTRGGGAPTPTRRSVPKHHRILDFVHRRTVLQFKSGSCNKRQLTDRAWTRGHTIAVAHPGDQLIDGHASPKGSAEEA